MSEFDEIRPYETGEMGHALDELLGDRHFNIMMRGIAPWLPGWLRNGLFRLIFIGVKTPLDFQVRFMKPVVRYVLSHYANGASFDCGDLCRKSNYTFVSNHRDIVLDSAILDYLLNQNKFTTTCEIAIGDNLLKYPWIKTLVRMNKAFIVRRSLKAKELLESSMLMSRYIHHAIRDKKENLWIAQREGRAKDSSDNTQDSVLKMLAMGGEGSPIESLKELNMVPLTISYEYDACDYLKAEEFQLKRDNPAWKKGPKDDLMNMKTGILGYKGHVHYRAGRPVNEWIDELKDLPRTEVFKEIARRMDKEIHSGYMLYPGNYVACDELDGGTRFADRYTTEEKQKFDDYVENQIRKVRLDNPDHNFLRERILTMYANPVKSERIALGDSEE